MSANWQYDGEERCAEAMARWMHRTQYDKRGTLYIYHLERVADSVSDVACAAAWLHDIVEDTPLTMRAIRQMFGPDTAEAVKLLTHDSRKRTYFQYIHRIAEADGKAGRIAREVKLADLQDNLSPARRFPNDQSLFRRHTKAQNIVLKAMQGRDG